MPTDTHGQGLSRFGGKGLTAELGLVPAAMLATPRAHDLANAKGHPAHQPEAAGQKDQHHVEAVVDICPDEYLLVSAPGAVGAYFILCHSSRGKPDGVLVFSPPNLLNNESHKKIKKSKEKRLGGAIISVSEGQKRVSLRRY